MNLVQIVSYWDVVFSVYTSLQHALSNRIPGKYVPEYLEMAPNVPTFYCFLSPTSQNISRYIESELIDLRYFVSDEHGSGVIYMGGE
jgi:hypothetical protein